MPKRCIDSSPHFTFHCFVASTQNFTGTAYRLQHQAIEAHFRMASASIITNPTMMQQQAASSSQKVLMSQPSLPVRAHGAESVHLYPSSGRFQCNLAPYVTGAASEPELWPQEATN